MPIDSPGGILDKIIPGFCINGCFFWLLYICRLREAKTKKMLMKKSNEKSLPQFYEKNFYFEGILT